MLLFIVNKIWNTDFIQENKFSSFLDLSNDFYIWNIVHGWLLNISKEEFVEKLPLLNGYINKYWFYDEVSLSVDLKLVKLQNIYEINFDEEKISKIPEIVENIKNYLNSWKLLTKSKKEEFEQQIKEAIYLFLQNIIKLYFIIYEAIKNKQELKKIINSDSILEEYKAQAKLLDYTWEINIERMITQLDFMLKQLSLLEKFYSKYKKNLWI